MAFQPDLNILLMKLKPTLITFKVGELTQENSQKTSKLLKLNTEYL